MRQGIVKIIITPKSLAFFWKKESKTKKTNRGLIPMPLNQLSAPLEAYEKKKVRQKTTGV